MKVPALDKVQPNSLADVIQLVPGKVTLNPNQAKNNQTSIRKFNNSLRNQDNGSARVLLLLWMVHP